VRLTVVSARLSIPSSTRLLADRLTEAVREQLADDGRYIEIRVIELRDPALDIVDNLATGFPLPALTQAIEAVTSADGMIAVTPIFAGSYSGLFKSLFDVIDDGALPGKAVWPLRPALMAIDRVSPSTCPLPRPPPPAA